MGILWNRTRNDRNTLQEWTGVKCRNCFKDPVNMFFSDDGNVMKIHFKSSMYSSDVKLFLQSKRRREVLNTWWQQYYSTALCILISIALCYLSYCKTSDLSWQSEVRPKKLGQLTDLTYWHTPLIAACISEAWMKKLIWHVMHRQNGCDCLGFCNHGNILAVCVCTIFLGKWCFPIITRLVLFYIYLIYDFVWNQPILWSRSCDPVGLKRIRWVSLTKLVCVRVCVCVCVCVCSCLITNRQSEIMTSSVE